MSEVPKSSVGNLPLERDDVEGKVNVDDGPRGDVVAKEGRYVFKPPSLDSCDTCRMIGLFCVMH
jgi:hypothetical protein